MEYMQEQAACSLESDCDQQQHRSQRTALDIQLEQPGI